MGLKLSFPELTKESDSLSYLTLTIELIRAVSGCWLPTGLLLVVSPAAAVALGEHHQEEHGAHAAHPAPEPQHAPCTTHCSRGANANKIIYVLTFLATGIIRYYRVLL